MTCGLEGALEVGQTIWVGGEEGVEEERQERPPCPVRAFHTNCGYPGWRIEVVINLSQSARFKELGK